MGTNLFALTTIILLGLSPGCAYVAGQREGVNPAYPTATSVAQPNAANNPSAVAAKTISPVR